MLIRSGLAIGVVATCMLSGPTHAQVQSQKDVTWNLGLEIAQGAIAECAKRNVPISVAVVDRAGRLRIFIAADNPSPHSLELARRKAYTARTFRIPSGEMVTRLKNDPSLGLIHLSNVIANQGALPIKVGDETIGAVGASGAPGGEKDEACVKAGIEKVADQLK